VGTKLNFNGQLLRIDRKSFGISVLSTLLGPIVGVDWIPQTGEYVVVSERTLTYTKSLSWVTPSGKVRYSAHAAAANCVTVNQKTGQVFVANTRGSVWEYTYSGSYKKIVNYGGSYSFTGIDCWEDQNVSVTTHTSRITVHIQLAFNRSPSASCFLALSFAPNPGLQFSPNHWLNLNPDPLFFLTMAGKLPYFTNGFAGRLSSVGNGVAYFVMPIFGVRVYVSAVAVNSAFPDGLDVGNVEVVDMW